MENDVRMIGNTGVVALSHYGERDLSKRWGFTDYVMATQQWSEFLVGVYFRPSEKSLVALYSGIETSKSPRIAAYAYWNASDRIYLSGMYDKGLNGSSDCYDAIFRIRLIDGNSISIFSAARLRQGYGWGIPLIMKFNDALGEGFSAYVSFTQYYNTMEYSEPKWIPAFSLNLEF